MQPKESKTKQHFIASMFKSLLRIMASVAVIVSDVPEIRIAGVILMAAEVLGIVEEF